MKKLVVLLLLTLNTKANYAQRGNNQLTIFAEAGVPFDSHKVGFGGYLRFAYGIGRSAQLTIMSGVSKFGSTVTTGRLKENARIIPVLVGYKYNIHTFYIEPQAGYGELGGKIDIGGDYARPSVGAFTWSVGGGYNHKRIDIGIRYQSAHGTQGSAAGTWHAKRFRFIGIRAGLDLINR